VAEQAVCFLVEDLPWKADSCVPVRKIPAFIASEDSAPRPQKRYRLSVKYSKHSPPPVFRRSETGGGLFNVRVTCSWILPHFLAISCRCTFSFGSWKRSRCTELEMTGMKVRSVGGRQFSPRPPDPVPVSTRKQQRTFGTATINHTSAVCSTGEYIMIPTD
jgi:hypothetical protein